MFLITTIDGRTTPKSKSWVETTFVVVLLLL